MASIPRILEGRFPVRITVAIPVETGDLLAYNGSAWVLADADTPATLYARLIAGESVDGSVTTSLTGYKEALIEDDDAPYTLGAKQYLSGTAGAHTESRPAVTKLVQVVGQALSTSVVHMLIRDLHEVEMYAPCIGSSHTGTCLVLDSGDFVGYQLDAQNEYTGLTITVPDGCVSVASALAYLAAEATAGTPTFDLTVSSAIDGAQWDAITQDATIADSAAEGGAADEMQATDISTALDATNILRPGALLGLKFNAKDAGTDIRFIYGVHFVFNCV